MSKQDVKNLRSNDPETRKKAIRAVAKEKDRSALSQLAIMAGDDPEPELRELARKAGVYIREQLGELQAAPKADAKPEAKPGGKKPKIPVDPKRATEAQNLMSAALSFQLNEEMAKAAKALTRAMALDPNLKNEEYFVSLAEAVTNASGEEALRLLGDTRQQENIAHAESERKTQKAHQQHEDEVSKVTWRDVAFDLGLFFAVATVCAVIGLFVLEQSAQRYIDSIQQNVEDVELAIAEGRIHDATDDEGNPVFIREEPDAAGNPVFFQLKEYDDAFFIRAQNIANAEFSAILVPGIGMGIIATLIALLTPAVTHAVGNSIFKGRGKLPYLIHQVSSLLTGRTIILLIIAVIGCTLIFSEGGGTVVTIVAAITGIFALVLVLSIVGKVSKTYDFGFVPALISLIPGIVVAAALGGGAAILLMG